MLDFWLGVEAAEKFSVGCSWASSCSGMLSAIPGLPVQPLTCFITAFASLRWQLVGDPKLEEGQSAVWLWKPSDHFSFCRKLRSSVNQSLWVAFKGIRMLVLVLSSALFIQG